MALKSINVNNDTVTSVDEQPIIGSKNLVTSNGIAQTIYGSEEIFSQRLYGVGSPTEGWAKWSVQLSSVGLNVGDSVHIIVTGHNVETLKTYKAYFYINGFKTTPAGQAPDVTIST